MNKQELNKLTKAELIEKVFNKEVEVKEVTKEVIKEVIKPEPLMDVIEFKEDSKYSRIMRQHIAAALKEILDDEVVMDNSISKFEYGNFVSHSRLQANEVKRGITCKASNPRELHIWLQHVSAVLVHELVAAMGKGTYTK